jgi:hypothetical protein
MFCEHLLDDLIRAAIRANEFVTQTEFPAIAANSAEPVFHHERGIPQ